MYEKLGSKHVLLKFITSFIKMSRNAKYMIKIKLLESSPTNWKGLTGGAALEVGKNCRKQDWTMPKADSVSLEECMSSQGLLGTDFSC